MRPDGNAAGAARDLLSAALTDARAEVRRRALLSGAAPRAAVARALSDPVWCVREAAALAAGQSSECDESTRAALTELSLRDPSPHVRAAAALAAGPHVRPERDYGAALAHQFERQRIRAALALGYVPPERAAAAVALLTAAVVDSHAKVRLAALRALGRVEAEAVLPLVPEVVRRCAEADPKVAAAAREVWARALTTPAAEPLRPLGPFPGTTDRAGAQAVADALSPDHPLRRAWATLPPVREAGLSAHRFARHLATACGRVLAGATRAPIG